METIMIWLLILLAGVGLSHIVVDGSIFSKPRSWVVQKGPEWLKTLVTCYQCVGFWNGLFLGVLSGIFINEWSTEWVGRLFLIPLFYAAATSYLSMAGAATLNYLDQPWKGSNES
jgi:hypothetical protein